MNQVKLTQIVKGTMTTIRVVGGAGLLYTVIKNGTKGK